MGKHKDPALFSQLSEDDVTFFSQASGQDMASFKKRRGMVFKPLPSKAQGSYYSVFKRKASRYGGGFPTFGGSYLVALLSTVNTVRNSPSHCKHTIQRCLKLLNKMSPDQVLQVEKIRSEYEQTYKPMFRRDEFIHPEKFSKLGDSDVDCMQKLHQIVNMDQSGYKRDEWNYYYQDWIEYIRKTLFDVLLSSKYYMSQQQYRLEFFIDSVMNEYLEEHDMDICSQTTLKCGL